jgi:hypothetical protein
MRGQSYSNKHNNSHKEDLQGGETKVMKKSLKMLLIFALVFSMFAPAMAFAAETELTAQAKYDALVEAGIFKGHGTGEAGLEESMTRGQLAVVLARLNGHDDTQAASSKPFPDVSADHWAASSIEVLKADGVFQGNGDGTFGVNDNMTFEAIVVTTIRALGLEEDALLADLSTSATVSSWAKAHVAYAEAFNLVEARADYTAEATRADLVAGAYTVHQLIEASQLAVESTTVVDASNIEVTFNNGDVVAVELDVALEANVATEVTFEHKGLEFTVEVTHEVDVVAPAVLTATADNLNEIVLQFDEEVNVDNATFTLSNSTVVTAALSDDKTAVVLTLATAAAQQEEVTVSISGVVDVAGNELVGESTVVFLDTTVPFAKSIELTGPQSFEITFNEPIVDGGSATVLVDNGIYGASIGSFDGRVVKVDLATVLTEGEYTVEVSGIADAAGFSAPTKSFTLNYVKDTTIPTVSVKSSSQEKVTVVFSKPVKNVSATNFYHTFSAWIPVAVEDTDGVAVNPANFYGEVVVVFAQNGANDRPLIEGTNEFHVLAGTSGSELKDKWGNKLAADTTFSLTVSSDKTVPTVTKVVATNEDIVKVTFSEAVVGAGNVANYKAYDADGVEVTTLFTATYDSTDKVATLDFLSDLVAGTYTLEVKNVTDTSINANKIVTATYAFTITDLTAPASITEAVYVQDGSKYYVYVTFPEQMSTSGSTSILEKANYRLNGVKLASADSIALFGGSSKVKITTATDPSGLSLSVKSVADASGNEIDLFTILSKTVTAETAPLVTGIKTIALNKVEVTYDKHLSSAPASAFEVNNVTPASAVFTNNSNGTSTLTLTLRAAGVLSDSASTTVVLDVVTANSVKSVTGQVVAVADAVNTGSVTDGIAPTLASSASAVVSNNGTTITLTFSENLDASTFAAGSTLNGFSVNGGTATITSAELATPGTNGNVVVITGTNFVAGTTTVSYTAGYVTDLASNKLASFSGKATE